VSGAGDVGRRSGSGERLAVRRRRLPHASAAAAGAALALAGGYLGGAFGWGCTVLFGALTVVAVRRAYGAPVVAAFGPEGIALGPPSSRQLVAWDDAAAVVLWTPASEEPVPDRLAVVTGAELDGLRADPRPGPSSTSQGPSGSPSGLSAARRSVLLEGCILDAAALEAVAAANGAPTLVVDWRAGALPTSAPVDVPPPPPGAGPAVSPPPVAPPPPMAPPRDPGQRHSLRRTATARA
jgi:hypothetical protein